MYLFINFITNYDTAEGTIGAVPWLLYITTLVYIHHESDIQWYSLELLNVSRRKQQKVIGYKRTRLPNWQLVAKLFTGLQYMWRTNVHVRMLSKAQIAKSGWLTIKEIEPWNEHILYCTGHTSMYLISTAMYMHHCMYLIRSKILKLYGIIILVMGWQALDL